jgi:hypothetical protein
MAKKIKYKNYQRSGQERGIHYNKGNENKSVCIYSLNGQPKKGKAFASVC